MFNKTKVKKVFITILKVAATAGALFIGYKVTSGRHEEPPSNVIEAADDQCYAPENHLFDLTFTDRDTGEKYISEKYCFGSYVNDTLNGVYFEVEDNK